MDSINAIGADFCWKAMYPVWRKSKMVAREL